jgi:hypothetical protein
MDLSTTHLLHPIIFLHSGIIYNTTVSRNSVKEAVVNRIEQDTTAKKTKTVYNKDITTRQRNKGN